MKYDNNAIVYILDRCTDNNQTLNNCISNIINKIGNIDTDSLVYNVDNIFYVYFDLLSNQNLVEQYNNVNTSNKLPNGCIELIFNFESIGVNLIKDKEYYDNVISYYNSSSYTNVNMLVNDMCKLYSLEDKINSMV